MKKIKTWLKKFTVQNRFTDISIVHTEKDISKYINVNGILTDFQIKI